MVAVATRTDSIRARIQEAILVLRVFILAAFSCCAIWSTANAAISIQTVPIHTGLPFILIKGDFTLTDDPMVLAREVTATGAKVVTFDSNGGNVASAIAYGKMIRSLGLSSIQLRSTQCASACALAFVGGVNRKAEPGSIGVHQASFSPDHQIDSKAAVSAVQQITADIMAYFIEMGVDPKLLQLSLSIDSEDMRYLTASEMETFKVTTGGQAEVAIVAPIKPSVPSVPSVPSAPTVPTVPTQKTLAAEPAVKAKAEDPNLLFLKKYFDEWSQPNSKSLTLIRTLYADSVTYYGKVLPKDKVLEEKMKFAERWPKRAYSARFETMYIACAKSCTGSAVVDWYANSPTRNAASSGSANFTLVWDASTGKVVSETGNVIAVDKGVVQPKRIIAQWYNENGNCRGGSGDSDETWKACDRRESIGVKLDALGWCYGRPDEHGPEWDWHLCDQRDQVKDEAQTSPDTDVTAKGIPRREDFPVKQIFSGKTKLPDFKRRDRQFNNFRTRIRDGMASGPNFAGKFTVIQIGCGTGCSFVIVADNSSGKPAHFPRGGEDAMYLQLKFELKSRLFIAQWASFDDGKCFAEYFDYDNENWNLLNKNTVGVVEACYNDISVNLK